MTNQISCKVVADSIAPSGARLFTVECCYPRFIHSELMTHRALSRNAASSRAIPVKKQLDRVMNDPAMPVFWGVNQKGMQAEEELVGIERQAAIERWLVARDDAVQGAEELAGYGLHKQIANRILEPFVLITSILSATEWGNFFWLRCHKDAQPEMRQLAMSICQAYFASTPVRKEFAEWHLPYVSEEDYPAVYDLAKSKNALVVNPLLARISAARCARVSYLTHDGKRDINADLALYERLEGGSGSGHWSPLEHPAQSAGSHATWSGNFRGWYQFRQMIGEGRDNRSIYLNSPEAYWNRGQEAN